MSNFPFLSLLVLLPLGGAVVVALLPKDRPILAKQVALVWSLVVLALTVAMWAAFSPGGDRFQFRESYTWIKPWDAKFILAADGIALVMLALIALLVPVVILASWHDAEHSKRSVPAYFALLLALECTMLGVFAAADVFLFYVFFEVMLVPMYFLIGSYGGARRQYAAVKFFLYSLVGGLFMLAAVIGLWVLSSPESGGRTFDWQTLVEADFTTGAERWLFLGFFLAFAIKAPFFPFHTWLPDAGSAAPAGAAALLVGVLDKVGTFGILRYCLPLFPEASRYFAPLGLALALVGVIYGALLAIGQNDLKRLVAYTSIAHFGFIGIGIFAFTTQAGSGAVLYMVNHGLATGLLFLVVGMFVARRGSALVGDFGGAGKLVPVLAGVFLVAGMASLALAVRLRVPGADRYVHRQQARRDHRDGRHHPRRRIRAVDDPAHHARAAEPRDGEGRVDAPGPVAARGRRRDPADRADPAARRVSQAGPRRHQPRGAGHPGRHRQEGPGAHRRHPGGWKMSLAAETLRLPTINYAALAPMLILFGVACVGVLVEAALPRARRFAVQFVLAVLGLAAALVMIVRAADIQTKTAGGAVAIDGPGLFLQGSIVVLGFVALLLISERTLELGGAFVSQAAVTANSDADRDQAAHETGATEVFPLAIFSLAGMMLFASANDLLTMFIALEVFSLPLYLLCALARRRRLLSQEAALKYFLLGSFASAFFLFGVALIYGFAGQVDFARIHDAVLSSPNDPVLLYVGLAMLAIGLLFKAAAAPFHVWTPDVYQGAPTPITALMAACTKVAAFGGLLRVLYVAFYRVHWDFRPVLGVIAVLTMLVGSVLAVTQTDIKRLLAYSSIANAGYILVGVLAVNKAGLASSLFYLVAYGFAVLAAFGIVTLVRDADGEATHLSRWAGLGRRSPLFSALFTFLLLAFAGIPLTSGFNAKFGVFAAAIEAEQVWLVIAGVVTSAVVAFPYLRVVVMMWLSEPGESTPTVSLPGALTAAAVTIGVAATLLLGVVPQPLLVMTETAGEFVR